VQQLFPTFDRICGSGSSLVAVEALVCLNGDGHEVHEGEVRGKRPFAAQEGHRWPPVAGLVGGHPLNSLEQNLARFLDDAPVIVWLTDPTGSCIFLNRQWFRWTGQPIEAGLGAGWLQALHPDDRAVARKTLQEAGAKREGFRMEYRLQSSEGNYRWGIASAAPRFGPGGDYLGFLGTVADIDDRKEAEERLRGSERRYRNLFESIDEGFCVIEMIFDPDGRPVAFRWLETNPTFEQQAGLVQAVGNTARQLIPDLDESWFEIYGRVALTGDPVRFENHAPAMSRWFDVFAFQMDRPEQRRVALLFKDISDRKTRELNAAFLADLGGDFAKSLGSEEMMALVGEKLCRHLRVQSAAFVDIDDAANTGTIVHERRSPGQPSIAGTHDLSNFMDETFLRDLRAGRTVAVADVSKDSRTREMAEAYHALGVSAHIQSSYLSEGRWRFMLSVHCPEPREWRGSEIDLMRELCARVWLSLERARAEESLRDSERQARAFFEGSGVGAAQVGLDRIFRKVNDRLCQITGYSREELLQMTPIELDHPDERELDRERFQRLFDDPTYAYDVEKRYCCKDGRTIWVHVNARSVRGSKGDPLYTAAIIEDITDRKRAEKALRESERNLRELSRSLEQRVAERTAELEEQAVRLRYLAAELASAEHRERKRLAALLHDHLQQYLVAARMQLNNTGRRLKDEAERRSVEKAAHWIGEAANAARDLTRQLRPPALYEDSVVAALHWLASEMKERHQLLVLIEGGEMTVPVSDDVKALLFDAIRELLLNVVKYAEVREAAVRVWEEDESLCVMVEDGGAGFDVAAASQSRASGGFGLFSIRERLAALGGRISVESVPGDGTRISLEVPLLPALADGPEVLPDKLVQQVRGDPPAERGERRIRILVVDDHAMVRQGLATLLDEDERLVVVGEAADGVEAIEAVEQHRPDVMLVDLNMPRMNGIEATREVHRRWPETIIIGLSVQDDDITARAIMAAGAAAFLSKAGDSDRMIATIVDLAGNTPQVSDA
jgi:PAS domain S-box-containing protein